MISNIELTSVLKASSLGELYFSGEIKERPQNCLSAIILAILERIRDLFTYRPAKQGLENKVVDTLYKEFECGSEDVQLKIAEKIKVFSLGDHFKLRCEADKVAQIKEPSFEKTIGKAKLAWIRKDVEVAGGANGGTYYILDLKEKKIGVFKSSEEHRSLVARVGLSVKRFFGQRSYLNTDPMTESMAEVAANKLDQLLQGNLTVQSAVTEFNGTKGCLQSYAEGMSSEESKKIWLQKENYQKEELVIFQKFAIFDYAIGNLDRHGDNWFIRVDEKGDLKEIKAIDNANTFPERAHSSQSFFHPPYNQYAWARETVAKKSVESEVREWMAESFSKEKRQGLVDALKSNADLKDFLTQEMESQFLNRLAVLFELSTKEDFKPSDLLHYRFEDAILEIIKN